MAAFADLARRRGLALVLVETYRDSFLPIMAARMMCSPMPAGVMS